MQKYYMVVSHDHGLDLNNDYVVISTDDDHRLELPGDEADALT